MRAHDAARLRELAGDISKELRKLTVLYEQVQSTKQKSDDNPQFAELFYESIALKFHNFYTGCERIFSLIAVELNGGLPRGADWHVRLLSRMSDSREDRVAVISEDTETQLREFLGFRHVVRNIYGFELDMRRMDMLLERYPGTWQLLSGDLEEFVTWLKALANDLTGLE